MGTRKEGAGRMGVPDPPRPGQLRALQLPLGFREEESYNTWKSSPETRVSLCHPCATWPLPGHSPILQLCPESCQAFGTQTSCLLKESVGETGFCTSTSPPKRKVNAQDPRRWMKALQCMGDVSW